MEGVKAEAWSPVEEATGKVRDEVMVVQPGGRWGGEKWWDSGDISKAGLRDWMAAEGDRKGRGVRKYRGFGS